MINNSGFLYNGGNKLYLMLIFPGDFNKKGLIFYYKVFEIIMNVSSPNSRIDLFSEP